MRARWWIAPVAMVAVTLSVACGGDDKNSLADTTPTGDSSATVDASATAEPIATGTPFVQTGRTPVLEVNLQDEPCSIMTADEVKAAAGGNVQSTDPVADKAQPSCRWIIDSESQGDVKVLQVRATIVGNVTIYDAAVRQGKSDIGGLGDGAYALPMATNASQPGFVLWVKKGEVAFSIFVTPADPGVTTDSAKRQAFNDRALIVATQMALVIAGRL